MDLFSELNNLMAHYSFKPSKKFSQNFLINKVVLDKMVALAELKSSDVVLEIGSGTGFLTKELLKHCKVIGIELDEKLIEILKKEILNSNELSERKNFELIEGDFLKVELPEFNKIVSCPPYQISSGIMYKLFSLDFDFAVFLLQREFVEKLLAEENFVEYTAITVLINYFFEPVFEFKVANSSFFPAPKTESAVIKLISRKRFGKVEDEQLFIKFVKNIFRFKNKNFSNALKQSFDELSKTKELNKEKVFEKANAMKHSTEKVQSLSVKALVKIFNELF